MARPRKAIIVAAGMGRRLGPHSANIPKCLVEVGGRPILRHQVEALRAAGVERIAVVRGYLGHTISYPDLVTYENPDYQHNNILASLFYAAPEMEGGFFFSYADILYRQQVTQALAAAPGDIVLVVDRLWHQVYEGRDDHPVPEAELTAVDGHRVLRVGKGAVAPSEARGEFIGLAKLSAAGAALLSTTYAELAAEYRGREQQPFQRSPRFATAYLTDLLNYLIDHGHELRFVEIDGQWREIDTVSDLLRVRGEGDW